MKYPSGKIEAVIPVNDISEEVVVLEPVVRVDLLVVDGEGPSADTALIFRRWVSSELSRKNI